MSEGAEDRSVYVASEVSKAFGGVQALQDVSFTSRAGEVHALLGANGAGKSTLVKILAGVMAPDSGRLSLAGEEVDFASHRAAAAAGIAIVSQELNLFPELTVLENLFLMREPRQAGVLVDKAAMRARALPVLAAISLPPSTLDRPLRALSLGARQLVEIARALLDDPRVLILDEPTSALKAAEARRLLDVVRDLRRRDVAIVFVSHFIEDVFAVADTVTVLRSGRLIESSTPIAQLTPQLVTQAMLGEAVRDDAGHRVSARALPIPPAAPSTGPLVLDGVSSPGVLTALSLRVEPGEIVGLAGLEGSGASETLRLLFGQLKLSAGTVMLPEGGGAPRSPLAAVRSGVAYVPADRKADGLILQSSIYENVTTVTAGPLRRLGLLPSTKAKRARAEVWREPVGLVMASTALPAEALSGGNQQKVVFAKWLESNPSLVLLDDPTRGVDVGAKADMQNIIRAIADSGRVVLYASTDLEEMARLCDRVVVFYRGKAVGELGAELDEHRLLEATTRGIADDVAPALA